MFRALALRQSETLKTSPLQPATVVNLHFQFSWYNQITKFVKLATNKNHHVVHKPELAMHHALLGLYSVL